MPAARQQRDPWEFKPREDLSTSMAVFAGTSRSANASFSYSSHESGGSSATYEFRSQRSDEPVADDFTEHSSSLQRQPVTPITTESVRLGDKRLHELGAAAASSVNWPELEMELAAASLSASHKSVWKRKKMSKSYSNDTMKLFTRNTIADHRHRTRWGPKGFAVLADGILPCSAQELRLVFRVHSTDIFRDVMRSVYRREFVEGELLRTIKIQQGDVNPARASDTTELSVKTATFEGSSVFSKNEAWCFLELLQPRDWTKESQQAARRTVESSTSSALSTNRPPAFTRTLVSVSRANVVVGNVLAQPPRSQQQIPNVVISYSFEEDSSGRATRVVFHGEYLPPDSADAFKRASHERRLARLWLLRLAASCHRFLLVVRRRRLGMQVIVNSTRLPLETVAQTPRCACCRRSFSKLFKRSRKRLCCLCGYLVCEKCAHAQEREHRARGDARPQIEQVRVCERCLVRVDQARFTAVTEEDLRPARVVSDAHTPPSRSNSTPGGSLRGIPTRPSRPTLKARPASLNDLLLDTLANASVGGPAERKRKASVLSVMKDLVDDERARRRASSARIRSKSAGVLGKTNLPLLGENNESDDEDEDERMGNAPVWDDDYPLANNDSRNYAIDIPDDPLAAIAPPIPSNEAQRLQLIREQQLDDLGDVPELGIICSLAARELSCAVSMITIVAKSKLHVLASTHPAITGGQSYPRDQGFCTQTILDPHPLVSRHVQADVRFSAMSTVRKMGVNFYCGFPLLGPDGKTVIGSVCCADTQARDLTRSQYSAMSSLASTAARVVQRTAEHRAVREGSIEEGC